MPERVRVLHILPSFVLGGAERMATQLMLALPRDRFDVAAVSLCSPVGTQIEHRLAAASIPVTFLDKHPGFAPRLYPRLNHVLREFKPHVVHTHLYVLRYALPPMLWRRARVMIHTVHNLAEREADRFGRWVARRAFRCGVVPVALGEVEKDSVARLYGPREIPVIPNGIDLDDYRQPAAVREHWRRNEHMAPDDIVFLSVGRLEPQKNHALLLQAFAQGPANDRRARLLIVGDGSLRAGLEQRVRNLKITDRVRFLGLREDVPQILAAADVSVLSSSWEGCPLTVMEAMAASKPVVATAVGGVPELVKHQDTGLLVPPDNAPVLAEAMRALLLDAGQRQSLGRRACEYASSHFSADLMARAYAALYERLLADHV